MRPKVQQIGARWHRPSAVSVRGGGWGSRAHPHLGGPSRIRSPSTSHSWNSRDPTWLPSLHEGRSIQNRSIMAMSNSG